LNGEPTHPESSPVRAQPAPLRARLRLGRRGLLALEALPFSLGAAALLLFQLGYGFEVGDQLQYLLLPYRQLFPSFLPGDWFTWHTSHYHESFAWVVRQLYALDREHLPRAVFVAHTLNLVALGYSLWRLARALSLGLFEATLTVASFALVRQIGLAGAVLNHAMLVPADLALPPFLLAAAAYAERRTLALGAWLGLSGLLHANYAVLGPLVLMPLEAARVRDAQGSRRLALACLLFALIAAPTLYVVVGSFLVRDAAPSAVAVTLFVRSPHHYDLRSMRADEFYYAFVLLLVSAPRFLRRVGPERGYAAHLQLTAAMLGAILLGVIGSGLHVLSLARLFPWRMSIPLFALLLLAVASTLRGLFRQRRWLELGWAIGGCALTLSFAQTDPLENSPWLALPLVAAGGGAAFGLATLLVLSKVRARALLAPALVIVAMALAFSVVRTPYWQGAAFVPPRGLHWLDGQIRLQAPTRYLYAWIRRHTPNDARFLIPPGQSSFRMHARRAIFIDWKCAPMKGDEALEWKRRMLAAMGLHDFPARGYMLPRAADAAYAARPLSDLSQLARSEGMTHILARGRASRAAAEAAGLHVLIEHRGYAVYEIVR
jgi:hypothetical protein